MYRGIFFGMLSERVLTVLAPCVEAGLAQDRAAALFHWAGLEGHLARSTALSADSVVHFARGELLGLALRAAILAALGSAQVAGSVKLLLAFCEGERGAAVAA